MNCQRVSTRSRGDDAELERAIRHQGIFGSIVNPVRVQGVGGVNRLGYGRCQGPAASGEGAGWPLCQALAVWIR